MQDQILEVNGISLVGVTQDFAANTLRNTSGKVRYVPLNDFACIICLHLLGLATSLSRGKKERFFERDL